MNDLPRATGLTIAAEWRAAGAELAALTEEAAHVRLNLNASYRTWVGHEVADHRHEIARLLRELADEFEAFYRKSEWVCVLGM